MISQRVASRVSTIFPQRAMDVSFWYWKNYAKIWWCVISVSVLLKAMVGD